MFDIVGDKVQLSADWLAIPPFKEFYNSTKDKKTALKQIEYVVWLHKWDSPYTAYDPEFRLKVLGKDLFNDEGYKPTKEMIALAARFNDLQNTPLLRLYKAAEVGLEYLICELNTLQTGDSTLEPLEVSRLLKEVEPISKSLENAKRRAMSEQADVGKVKGGGKLGYYEKPKR